MRKEFKNLTVLKISLRYFWKIGNMNSDGKYFKTFSSS